MKNDENIDIFQDIISFFGNKHIIVNIFHDFSLKYLHKNIER